VRFITRNLVTDTYSQSPRRTATLMTLSTPSSSHGPSPSRAPQIRPRPRSTLPTRPGHRSCPARALGHARRSRKCSSRRLRNSRAAACRCGPRILVISR
jgi:hypothetical protein